MAGNLIYPAARKLFHRLRSKLNFLIVVKMSESVQKGHFFPDTQWSLVMRLKSPDTREARRATEEVFTSYRYPLSGFLRRDGLGHEDAEDVLHGFFEKMLRNDSLGDADRARGKLRTFLLTALSRFKLNWQRGERRRHQRVQAEADLWDADEARWRDDQHATQETPEHFFDRRWAAQLIDHVRAQLREIYEKRGKQELHNALSPLLSSSEPELESFPAIAERLNLTENALRVALHRMRKDFSDLLLREVKGTLDEGEDARAEIQHLLSLFET
jgi:RNA polymerase sigma-70 factor (ECF subfamily)